MKSRSRIAGWSLSIVVVFAIVVLVIWRATGTPPGTGEDLPLLPSPL